MKTYYVYILTNKNNKVIYIGVTNDLERRIQEHKKKAVKGFTQKYNLDKLVYFEETIDVNAAIAREKMLKGWLRKKKDDLVASMNPRWEDLSTYTHGILRCAQDDNGNGMTGVGA